MTGGRRPCDPVVDADEDRGGAVRAEPVGLLGEAAGVESVAGQEVRAAQQGAVALDLPGDALADRGVEVGDLWDGQAGVGGGVEDGAAERVLGGTLDARGEPEQSSRSNPADGTIRVTDG